jgi:hypothetical protein
VTEDDCIHWRKDCGLFKYAVKVKVVSVHVIMVYDGNRGAMPLVVNHGF